MQFFIISLREKYTFVLEFPKFMLIEGDIFYLTAPCEFVDMLI